MMKVIASGLTALLLCSCTLIHETPEIQTPACIVPARPQPAPLVLNDIGAVVVITPETVNKKFDDIRSVGDDPTLVCISPNGYRALSLNMEKIQGYIEVLRATK